jgi:hypothetical protein
MADEMSLQALEEVEKHFQRVIDLLTQADQALREVKVANQAFGKAHHYNEAHGHNIEDALEKIENVIGQATPVHNEAVARIKEARAEAQQREEAPGGGSS